MGPTALLPFQRKSYSGLLCSEKIHRPRPGLNRRTSDPVTSMITTRPLGSTISVSVWPTCSADLTVCDIYLCGGLKDKMHKKNPHTLEKLKEIRNNTITELNRVNQNGFSSFNRSLLKGEDDFSSILY